MNKCIRCHLPTMYDNLICEICRQEDHNDYDDDCEEVEFIPCDKCDGHPACEDYGCAYEHGLGGMVKRPGTPWA